MTARPAWLASLTAVVSAAQIDTASPSLHDYTVDGLTPQVVVYPDSAEQVAALLHWAQQEKLAVLPCGGATTLQLGNVPNRLDVVISTSHLTQVHEYDVANFTLTAGAGVPFSQVAELTATRMQTLPLHYAFSAATLGGLVATQAYNPKRLLYGGVRDLLLGLRVALPSGEIAHFGGKVVKNVAGYDMSKLFVGSLGALGIIVETTWKLFALPERDESLLAVFPSLGQGASAVAQIMATQLQPSQMLLLHSTAARTVAPDVWTETSDGGTLFVVNSEGMEEAVERQLIDISRLCQGQGATAIHRLAGEAQAEFRSRLGPLYLCVGRRITSAPRILVRLGTLISRVPYLMDALVHLLGPLASRTLIAGDCGTGLVKLGTPWSAVEAEALTRPWLCVLRDLPRLVAAEAGYVVIEEVPLQLKRQLDVWGPPPPSLPLLRTLKNALDPAGILSPGRFIGGL
jgi:glycolate oxidase FAD binding subunit